MTKVFKAIIEFFKEPLNTAAAVSFLFCGVSLWTSVAEALLWLAIALLLIANRHSLLYAKSMKMLTDAWEKQATFSVSNSNRSLILIDRYIAEVDYLKGKISKEAYEEKVKEIEKKLEEFKPYQYGNGD